MSIGIVGNDADLGTDIILSQYVAVIVGAIDRNAVTQPLVADVGQLRAQRVAGDQGSTLNRFTAYDHEQIARGGGVIDGFLGGHDAGGVGSNFGNSCL